MDAEMASIIVQPTIPDVEAVSCRSKRLEAASTAGRLFPAKRFHGIAGLNDDRCRRN
jgi:hypothetical protein